MTSQLSINKQFRLNAIGLACLVIATSAATTQAAPLALSQVPATSGGREPAPNVIITVDDSGSMAWDVLTDSSRITTGKKIDLLKTSLKAQFGDGTANSGKIPDDRIRLAWQAMHNNGGSPGASGLTTGSTNSIQLFSGTHRANFNSFVNSLSASGGTPSHDMMENVYNYMRSPAGVNNPWADNPGSSPPTYLACRRTYHIFMTDGAWNGQSDSQRAGTGDGAIRILGNGTTSYNILSTQTNAYKDVYGDATNKASTLADFAFRSWADDLQDGTGGTANIANSVKPLIKQPGIENVGTSATDWTKTCDASNHCTPLQEFWNPKNNPANWQHVSQYSIGFGNGATQWGGVAPNFDAAAANNNYAGDYGKLVNGEVSWPDVYSYDRSPSSSQQDVRTVELWHMALNGRGKYYPAKDANALTDAFSDILDTVIADTSKPLVSIATSSSYLRSGLNAYIAGFDAANWSGSLSARPIDGTSGAIQSTEAWNAATLLDSSSFNLSNRVVLSYDGSLGISWKTYSTLPSAQKNKLNVNNVGTVDSMGQERVDFIRGERSKEFKNGGTFRDRGSRLGDIVNSNIWYTGKPASGYSANNYSTFRSTGSGGKGNRTPMIYMGGNDGMLHGFSTVDGAELLAYIPQGIAEGDLRKLTDTTYTHQYFVDGSPFTGDAYIGATPAWKTVLLGTLGAGGKGYFVLDVTDPAQFTATNASSLVITDTTALSDQDIGVIVSAPVMDEAVSNKSRQIVKMNGGRWAAVIGNGYNSTNEAPVLIIQYLDGDKAIKKVSPCTLPTSVACSFKGGNGLSAPQLIDLNGDGTVDVAYAGDLKGNVWKFNLSSATDSAWSVAFAGQPFFATKPSKAITSAPFWMQHPLGGIMLAIGTGQNLTTADQSSTAIDSLYALYDNSTFVSTTSSVTITDSTAINAVNDTVLPTTLVQQTITGSATDNGTVYYSSSSNAVNYSGSTPKRGWYLNWQIGGQRVLQNIRTFTGQKILVQSMIPRSGTGVASNVETCTPSTTAERSFQSVFNMFTGNPSQQPVFTLTVTTTPNINLTTIENNSGETSLIRTDEKVKLLASNCPIGQVCNANDFNPGKFIGLRTNWREMQ